MSDHSPPRAIDPRGRFRRCCRCGWLDARTESTCAQCGLRVEDDSAIISDATRVELTVVHAQTSLVECSPNALASLRVALANAEPLVSDALVRHALVTLGGRVVLIAPSHERWIAAAAQIVAALAAMRGALTAWTDVDRARFSSMICWSEQLSSAQCAIVTAPLALDRASKDALRTVPWAIIDARAAFASGRLLTALHEVVSLARPELAGTRRSFIANFAGIERVDSHTNAMEEAALATLLSRVVLRVDESSALPDELAPIGRWLAAAARS